MDENHHYDLAIMKTPEGYKVIVRLYIDNIKSIEGSYDLGSSPKARLLK